MSSSRATTAFTKSLRVASKALPDKTACPLARNLIPASGMSSDCHWAATSSPSVTNWSDGRTNPSRAQRRLCLRSNSRLSPVSGRSASDCRNHQLSASHSASGNNGRKMLVRTDFVRLSCNSVTGLSSTRIDSEAHVAQFLTSGSCRILPIEIKAEVAHGTDQFTSPSRNRRFHPAILRALTANPCTAQGRDSRDALRRQCFQSCTTHTAESRLPRDRRNTEPQTHVAAIVESQASGHSTPCHISSRLREVAVFRQTMAQSCVPDSRHK